ncbi:hypothetical protein OG413_27765 [Streptomyces sp. NBC_01433]|nr:hypothetical protein [Streptomyces sp. NBC_01433]
MRTIRVVRIACDTEHRVTRESAVHRRPCADPGGAHRMASSPQVTPPDHPARYLTKPQIMPHAKTATHTCAPAEAPNQKTNQHTKPIGPGVATTR